MSRAPRSWASRAACGPRRAARRRSSRSWSATRSRGSGSGALLVAELARAACRVGIRRFTATTLAENIALVRLLDGLGGAVELRHAEGGVREITVTLPDCAGTRRMAA